MAKGSKAKKATTAGAASKRFEAALQQVEKTANASDSDSGDSFLDDDEPEEEISDDDESGSVDEFGMLKFGGKEKGEVDDDEADSGDEFAGFDDDGSSHEQTKSDDSASDEEEEEEEEGQAGYDSDSDNENGDLMNLKHALTHAAERAAAEKAEQERKIRKRKLYGDWADNAPPPLSDDDEDEDEDGKPREKKKKKVTLEDIRAHTSSAFGTRAIARLDELEKRAKGKSEVVKARLGRRIEQRVDRAAAYEIAKTEISKWDETVQQNRRAETLEFPLQQNRSAPDNVAQGMDDDAEFAGETLVHQLEGRQVSLEEVRARRNELRRMREMMFREEMKARRVKKIKSKTYRKVHKREREREEQVAAQLNGEDEDVDDDEEGYDKLVARARERMQLKHKNTSKWARDMKRMSLNKDKSNRAELEEMLRRGEELTQKVAGSDDDSSGDELPEDNDEDEGESASGSKKAKGIMQMKFMKDAEDRIRKSNQEEIAAIRRMQDDDDDAEDLEDQGDTAREVINEGRRRYGPGALEAQAEAQAAVDKSNEMEEDDRPSSIIKKRGRNIEIRHVQDDDDDAPQKKKGGKKASAEDAANPWIQDVDPGSVTKGGSLRAVDKDSSRSEKTEAKLKRARQRSAKAAAAAADPAEGDVQINVNEILQVRGVHDEVDGDDGEVPDAAVTMVAKNGRTEFQQKELFEEEKKHVVEDEGDKEIDVTLPGWGSWTGMGTRKSSKRFIEKVDGIKTKDRKDHKLQNVIINEKSIKKSAKYMTEKVPYPYETRAQYERAMRMPIGKEWSTQSTLQEATKPRVIVKPGVVIDPLTAPFS
ncbi:small-subunit processome [Myxozyma melibiosi]|uniref:Small-subunit processome n=1 Tax=Myxozyma melibiosi TaxID=54550 RepID=A0ABR1F1X7_9ASCO